MFDNSRARSNPRRDEKFNGMGRNLSDEKKGELFASSAFIHLVFKCSRRGCPRDIPKIKSTVVIRLNTLSVAGRLDVYYNQSEAGQREIGNTSTFVAINVERAHACARVRIILADNTKIMTAHRVFA